MELKITDSDMTVDSLLSIEDFNSETKNRIQNSDILLVPLFEFGGKKERTFYSETTNFFKFAKNNLKNFTINICENRGQEKILRLHSAETWLPLLLVNIDPLKDIALPTIISLISNYVYYISTKEAKGKNVRFQIIVHDKKRKISKKLEYEGHISGLNQLKKININTIFGDK